MEGARRSAVCWHTCEPRHMHHTRPGPTQGLSVSRDVGRPHLSGSFRQLLQNCLRLRQTNPTKKLPPPNKPNKKTHPATSLWVSCLKPHTCIHNFWTTYAVFACVHRPMPQPTKKTDHNPTSTHTAGPAPCSSTGAYPAATCAADSLCSDAVSSRQPRPRL